MLVRLIAKSIASTDLGLVAAPIEQAWKADPQRDRDPQERIDGYVGFAALNFADERLPNSGLLGQIALAHSGRMA